MPPARMPCWTRHSAQPVSSTFYGTGRLPADADGVVRFAEVIVSLDHRRAVEVLRVGSFQYRALVDGKLDREHLREIMAVTSEAAFGRLRAVTPAPRRRGRRAQIRAASTRALESLEASAGRACEAPRACEPQGGPRAHVAARASPMQTNQRLQVRVNHEFVLDAGTFEEVSGPKGRERLIRPPEPTLFHQLLAYLRAKPDPPKRSPGAMAGREGCGRRSVGPALGVLPCRAVRSK